MTWTSPEVPTSNIARSNVHWFFELLHVLLTFKKFEQSQICVNPPIKLIETHPTPINKSFNSLHNINRCKQILQNFATLANFSKSLAIFLFAQYLANFSWYWATYNCFQWPTIEQIIKPSVHTDIILFTLGNKNLNRRMWSGELLNLERAQCDQIGIFFKDIGQNLLQK